MIDRGVEFLNIEFQTVFGIFPIPQIFLKFDKSLMDPSAFQTGECICNKCGHRKTVDEWIVDGAMKELAEEKPNKEPYAKSIGY